MITNPTISVLMPVFNDGPYLNEAIDSVLCQTFKDFEFIIINDGSTDNSLDIINSYQDDRIILLQNKTNQGIAKSLNKGYLKTKGEFIARIDANDAALNIRFEKQIEYLINHSKCAVVFCPVLNIDERGNSLDEVSGPYIPHEFIQTWLFYKNCLYHTAAMMRKTSIPNTPYDESNLAEDYALWIDLLRTWELHIQDEVLMKVRNLPDGLRYQFGNKKSTILTKLRQLEWLHIYPNRMELRIHFGLEKKNTDRNPYLVKDKLKWLDKIYIANKKYFVFKEPMFTNKLVEHWNSFVNYINSPISIDLFYYILQSPLRKETKKSFLRTCMKYFPYIQLKYYLFIIINLRKQIWKLKIKLLSTNKSVLSSKKIINTQDRFDDQFTIGFWDYLSNLDELAHYSVILGYCYYWKTNPAILDIGCGDGVLWEKLSHVGYSYYEGIDLSKEALSRINHKDDKKTKFILSDMLDYSTNNLFDVIIFSESICYIKELEKISLILDKYRGFLNSHGKIIVSQWNESPNVEKIWNELDRKLILIDKVEIINRNNSKSTIKVFDAL